ncbi:hypothetical protein CTAYLR_004534 [Chrysophaeum taylorii]|uniref:26S proteasome regulatory subunit RPN2 C-terminal domain-containing protein n=1 Tax=Chrysophaeum taylorii TaxID=2483200 RepID=A0AAD7UMW6_9STRA|nr:hypothetical protein CTAYLR_004534 [Chrysophaeum taylorii]
MTTVLVDHGRASYFAGGAIAALEDEDLEVKAAALKVIHHSVDECWAEAANAVAVIEELSEDDKFPGHELAASVASKIFFHLEEYNESLRLALSAGSYFDVSVRSEYVETLVARCVDEYVTNKDDETLDPRLEQIVERMFGRCYEDGEFEHAVGIALEAQRVSKIGDVFANCPPERRPSLLNYVADATANLSRAFRAQVTRLLVELHASLDHPDHVFVCHALQTLDDASGTAAMLERLVLSTVEQEQLLAYQLAFLIVESANQKFMAEVLDALGGEEEEEEEGGEEEEKKVVVDRAAVDGNSENAAKVAKLKQILDVEGVWSELELNFLFSKSESDGLVIKNLKEAVDGNRNSVLHNAVVVAHGFMNAGTTNTRFLSQHLEWMGKASNWAKFTATASIGVVHAGHIKESIQLLQPYLPQAVSSSPYSEGGALYALGLIHANRGGGRGDRSSAAVQYLSDALRNAGNNEALQHGACFGIGLAAMGAGNDRLFEELKTVLFFDSAVAGEAAAYGIGLLLAGHGCSEASPLARNAVTELLAYARETAHEKIIRGLVLAIAIMVLGHESAADPIIEQLCRDRDAIVRYGGAYAVGLAYAGTAHNGALGRLLHVAVSDVSDDVRRAAVTNIGFLLFRQPRKVPTLVNLLAESFNPHVRYGACLAIGIACAGSGDSDALELVQPMMSDQVDFVRQGALLASALVYMQQSEYASPGVKAFREKIAAIVKDKYPSMLTKLGAIVAAGILDAGGRNCAVSLKTNSGGFLKASACIGLALWAQHWYWYPMQHFFSLALAPSMLVGLNKDFKLPNSFKVQCATSPAHFAYPPKLKEKKEVKKERVVTAILSTTLKQQARDKAKAAEKDDHQAPAAAAAAMDTSEDAEDANGPAPAAGDASPQSDDSAAAAAAKKSSYYLSNPSRITKAQQRFCSFDLDQRYVPVASTLKPAGVVILMDRQPADPEDAADISAPPVTGADDEAPMPEPFEWTPPEAQAATTTTTTEEAPAAAAETD